MSIQRNTSVPRNGLVARQVIIYGIALIVVAAACYEFLVARPAFQKVFDRITELDLSNKAINMTADEMEKEVLQTKPVSIRHEELNNAEIRTYQWPSGIVFRPHTIHVVYYKGAVRTKDNETRENLYYHSSVANARVGVENLPGLKETIMKNRNLSGLGMGGGGGGGGGESGGGDEDSSNEGDGSEDSGDGAEDEGNADDSSDSENEDSAADDSGKEEDGSAAPENKDQPPTEESGEQPADQPSEGEKPEEGDAGDDGQPAEGGDAPKEEDDKDGGGGGLNSPGFSTR